jgi:hypothetical protein
VFYQNHADSEPVKDEEQLMEDDDFLPKDLQHKRSPDISRKNSKMTHIPAQRPGFGHSHQMRVQPVPQEQPYPPMKKHTSHQNQFQNRSGTHVNSGYGPSKASPGLNKMSAKQTLLSKHSSSKLSDNNFHNDIHGEQIP